MILKPGTYLLSFMVGDDIIMKSTLDVDEMYYHHEAFYKEFLIPKQDKTEETKEQN